MPEIYISYFARYPLPSIPVFLTVVPIILILYRKAYLDRTFFILLIYLVVKFLIDLTMFEWAAHQRNTIILYNVNVPIRYGLTALMYWQKIEIPKQKIWIILSIPVFTALSIWDINYVNPALADQENHQMVLFSTTVESLLMLCWILLYFYNTIRALKIPNLLTYPFFWICSGLLIYYSSFLVLAPVLHYESQWVPWMEFGFLYYAPYIFESVSIILFSVGILQFPARSYAK